MQLYISDDHKQEQDDEIWSSHGDENVYGGLLGRDTVWTGM
jgi:hypothetical protein